MMTMTMMMFDTNNDSLLSFDEYFQLGKKIMSLNPIVMIWLVMKNGI